MSQLGDRLCSINGVAVEDLLRDTSGASAREVELASHGSENAFLATAGAFSGDCFHGKQSQHPTPY